MTSTFREIRLNNEKVTIYKIKITNLDAERRTDDKHLFYVHLAAWGIAACA